MIDAVSKKEETLNDKIRYSSRGSSTSLESRPLHKNSISCRLRVWTICLCYQDHKRLQYIDFTCWKAEICIIGIFISCNKIGSRSFLNLSDMKTYVTMLCLWHFLKDQWWFMWIWIFSSLPEQQTLCNAIMYWIM